MRTVSSVPTSQMSSANVVLGILMMVSPWLLRYFHTPTPTTNSELSGVLIILGAWSAALDTTPTAAWWNLVMGAWLVISPFVLGYAAVIPAMVAHVLFGLLIGWISFSVARRRAGEPVAEVAPQVQRRRMRA